VKNYSIQAALKLHCFRVLQESAAGTRYQPNLQESYFHIPHAEKQTSHSLKCLSHLCKIGNVGS